MSEDHESKLGRPGSFVRSVLGSLPNLIVLGLLAVVGYWGHVTGWQAGSYSDVFRRGVVTEPEDWCELHNVPDSRCIACDPELVGESGADWCKEHGVPEAKCTICHPEILVNGVASDWCREHGLPESGCTLCHPEIARSGEPVPPNGDISVVADPATVAKAATPVRDPATCQTHALKVQFASAEAMQKVGIRLATISERPMADSIIVNAEVGYDRTLFARVTSRVAGVAARVERELGDRVEPGELLALVDSADVGVAKAEYLKALTDVAVSSKVASRLEASTAAGFRTEADRLQAEGAAQEAGIRLFNARQALLNLGLPIPADNATQESIAVLGLPPDLLTSSVSANLIPVVAPFAGVIVSRAVARGDAVSNSDPLFEVADTRRMWITMHLTESDATRVALGLQVVFQRDESPDRAVTGTVSWMSTAVDERTRTVEIRADVESPDGSLRANSFGRARIVVRSSFQLPTSPWAIA